MDDDVMARLATVIRDVLEQPQAIIGPATTADDIDGWDSLAHGVMLMRIERAFGIRLELEAALAAENVGALAALVIAQLQDKPG